MKWVLSTYLDDPQVIIVADNIEEPELSGDALSVWWGLYVKQKFGSFDRVFTSEDYGDVFSKSMGAIHFQYNKARDIVPVSATKIRKHPITNWEFLNNFAKDYFVKKVAIVGTESTGKSTLTKQLAEHYSLKLGSTVLYVNEVGDEIVQNSNKAVEEQMAVIAEEHAKRILRQTRKTEKILFIDTDLNTTKSYSQFLFNNELSVAPWIESANEMDLYIYLLPDAPYIQDGRRLDKEDRDELHENHMKFYSDKNVMIVPFGGGYDERFKHITAALDDFIKKY